MNLNSLRFMTSQMSTRRIPSTEFFKELNWRSEWRMGLRRKKTISPTSSWGSWLSPSLQTSSRSRLGSTSCLRRPQEKQKLRRYWFSLVEVDFFPLEDANTSHGIGVQPYILMTKGDIETNPMPWDFQTRKCVHDAHFLEKNPDHADMLRMK